MHVRPHMCLAPVCFGMFAASRIHRSASFFRGFHRLHPALGASYPSLLSKQEETNDVDTDLFPQTHFVSLCEVLATIQKVTGYLGPFTHMQLTHVHPRPSDTVFYAGITGLGCNITIAKLAKISKNINQSTLERTVLAYFTNETLLE